MDIGSLLSSGRTKRAKRLLSDCKTEPEKRKIELALLLPAPIPNYIGRLPKRTLERNPEDANRGARDYL